MFGNGIAPFPVIYSDGNKESNVGTIVVDPSLNFKKLLSLLSQKIGISPRQLSIYLATVGSGRKIPITARVNLAAIPRDGAAYFFFVKRSRWSKKTTVSGMALHPNKKSPPENAALLREDDAVVGGNQEESFSRLTPPLILDLVEYEKRMRDFQMERERFLMNMATSDVNVGREASNGDSDGERNGGVVCEECSTGIDGGFHLCVCDEVTVGFRSSAGPIARPTVDF